jgi:hypothetical protein
MGNAFLVFYVSNSPRFRTEANRQETDSFLVSVSFDQDTVGVSPGGGDDEWVL